MAFFVLYFALFAGAFADSLTAINVEVHRSMKEAEESHSSNRVMRSERVVSYNGDAIAVEEQIVPTSPKDAGVLLSEDSDVMVGAFAAPALSNPGFEAATITTQLSTFQARGYAYQTPTGWSASSRTCLIKDRNSPWGSLATPDRSAQYLGMQSKTSYVQQVVTTVPGTTYVVTFSTASRPNYAVTATCAVAVPSNLTAAANFSLSSSWADKSFTFVATSASTTLKFSNCARLAADNTAFIDNVYMGYYSLLRNAGFEQNALPGNTVGLCPSSWNCFGSGQYLVKKGTGADGTTSWGNAQPDDGSSYIVLGSRNTYIVQTLATVTGRTYTLSLSLATYSGQGTVCVYNNSGLTNILTATRTSSSFASYSASFVASGTSTVMQFENCQTNGAVLLDSITILEAAATTTTSTTTPNCPWTEWNPWGPCSATCGSGSQTRNQTNGDCNQQQFGHQVCTEVGCPQDCELGDWTFWDQCNAPATSCLQGNITRHRVLSPAMNGGEQCLGQTWLVEVQCCTSSTCASDCPDSLNVPAGEVQFLNQIIITVNDATHWVQSHDNAVSCKTALAAFMGCPLHELNVTLYKTGHERVKIQILITSTSFPNVTRYATNFATLTPAVLTTGINNALQGLPVFASVGHIQRVAQADAAPVGKHAVVEPVVTQVIDEERAVGAAAQAAAKAEEKTVHEPIIGEKFATMSDAGPELVKPSDLSDPIRSMAMKKEVLLAAVIMLSVFA